MLVQEEKQMNDIPLYGCTPEPLMSYLKALGILRLVSEQADPDARGCWRNGAFWLRSKLDNEDLVRFFLDYYKPTPVIGPWAGGSGFFPKDNKRAVESIASSYTDRLDSYRRTIEIVKRLLDQAGIKDKPSTEEKSELLRSLRSQLPAEAIQWMDAAIVMQNDGQTFAPLLGTGGNDGRLDFSQNFMLRLITLKIHKNTPGSETNGWLNNSLFATIIKNMPTAAVGQFSPGRAGGPNSTQGMEGIALDNPWDFVLMIEGTLLFAGAAVRRIGVGLEAKSAFPFTVRVSAAGSCSGNPSDEASGRGEIWLPMWSRYSGVSELKAILGEGRAEVANRPARDGVDFARAVAGLGVDRGIREFARVSFLKRSGKAYLAAPLGRVLVRKQEYSDLLWQIDGWLSQFRRACSSNNAPSRFKSILGSIDNAIYRYCIYGGNSHFQKIVTSLAYAERLLAISDNFRNNNRLQPISGLTEDWNAASKDTTSEFEIALALSGMHDTEHIIPSIRSNLEPALAWRKQDGTYGAKWVESDRSVVWNSADLTTNLAAVLDRRRIYGQRQGCRNLPIAAMHHLSLNDIGRFLAGDVDDAYIEKLLWGLILIPQNSGSLNQTHYNPDAWPLPRAYAILKLLFLSEPLMINGQVVSIRPEASIIPLLTSGRIGEACRIAMRRLRASGLTPIPGARSGSINSDNVWQELDNSDIDGRRIAAALLLPISYSSIDRLQKMVTRKILDSPIERR